MGLKCPNCSSEIIELMSCDSCKTIGCIRCISRSSKQWLCHNCKAGNMEIVPKEAGGDLFSMFG